jgi:hypothetical protein
MQTIKMFLVNQVQKNRYQFSKIPIEGVKPKVVKKMFKKN